MKLSHAMTYSRILAVLFPGILCWQTLDQSVGPHQVVAVGIPCPMPKQWAVGGRFRTVSLLSRTSFGDKKSALSTSGWRVASGALDPGREEYAETKYGGLVGSPDARPMILLSSVDRCLSHL